MVFVIICPAENCGSENLRMTASDRVDEEYVEHYTCLACGCKFYTATKEID